MDFRKVLAEALKICGEHANDPFLLYCTLCDCAGNDYTVSPQVEMFHRFNKTYGLVAEMKKNPEPRMIGTLLEKCKKFIRQGWISADELELLEKDYATYKSLNGNGHMELWMTRVRSLKVT